MTNRFIRRATWQDGKGRNVGYRCSRMGAAGRAFGWCRGGGEIHWPDYLPVAACERLVRFAGPDGAGAGGGFEWLKYGWCYSRCSYPRGVLSGSNGKPILAGGAAGEIQFVSCGAICGGGSGARCGCGRGFGGTRRPADCERLAQRVSASEQACVAEGGRHLLCYGAKRKP